MGRNSCRVYCFVVHVLVDLDSKICRNRFLVVVVGLVFLVVGIVCGGRSNFSSSMPLKNVSSFSLIGRRFFRIHSDLENTNDNKYKIMYQNFNIISC